MFLPLTGAGAGEACAQDPPHVRGGVARPGRPAVTGGTCQVVVFYR